MEAVNSVLVSQKKLEFLLKMGKNFNFVSEKYSLTKQELFEAIFDHVYYYHHQSRHDEGKLLVATLKHPDPRVTLLSSRQCPSEDLETFKRNFATRVIYYLSREVCAKDFTVIFTIEKTI